MEFNIILYVNQYIYMHSKHGDAQALMFAADRWTCLLFPARLSSPCAPESWSQPTRGVRTLLRGHLISPTMVIFAQILRTGRANPFTSFG